MTSTPISMPVLRFGGTVISEEVGLQLDKATIKDLGRTRKVQVSKAMWMWKNA
ncbi:hypothetical protein [Silanimonas sp.]|uniref:hypothetical protein n=1 Tax=Silanimonas sp. TaxID=1929290 RepID=UPI001BBC4D8F|nr:hypothetical protein [Silanimonas sp.]MBS3895920.1 hypothetical protein [Silanimonas sp.]